MEKTIETLRKVFTVSLAAFDFAGKVHEATGKKYKPTKMHALHIEINQELAKENPDLETIDVLLQKMENQAKNNSHDKRKQS